MSTTVITELLGDRVEDRLQAPANPALNIAWPCLPRAATESFENKKLIDRRATLLRTSSFVKLRKFCNQSNAFNLLKTSSTALQASVNHALLQLKAVALILAVYTCLIILTLQLTYCAYALTGKATPPGLVFMIASVFAIIIAYAYVIVSFTKRNSRSARRVTFLQKKKTE